MDSPYDSAGVGNIWNAHYPFDYWDNRIEKLNPHNPHDALDAIFVHSHLADVYVTILTAKMKRPDYAWYVIKNELPTYEIYSTLEELEETVSGETNYYLDKLLEKPEGLVTVELPDEWDENIDYETALANQFLGCPAEFNQEKQKIETLYDPRAYIAVCNSVINYWDENGALLNDFKHGFRIIPFNWETVEWLYENDIVSADVAIEEAKDNYDKIGSSWTYDFWRMETDEEDAEKTGTPVNLEVHTADINKCIAFSRLILKLIYNLFDKSYKQTIESDLENLFGTKELGINSQIPIMHQQYSFQTTFREED